MAFVLGLFFSAVAITTVGLFLAKLWWLPELISVHGAAVDRQLTVTLTIAGVVFFLAQVALGVFVWKFRGRGEERASYWHENSKLEATWTILTAALFVGLGIEGNRVWAQYFLTAAPPDAVVVELTAQQFAWNIRYPGADRQFGRTDPKLIDDAAGNYIGLDPGDGPGKDDVVTQNIMAIPVNRPVRIILRSKDVTHSFFVPQLRVKQDAVPGMGIQVHFTSTRTGEFEIACAELCGMQHYKMRGRLLVMSDADFDTWLKSRAAL
jgi:cytochrome c oxidase subunit II